MNDTTQSTPGPKRHLSRRNFLSGTASAIGVTPSLLSSSEPNPTALTGGSATPASSPSATHQRATTYSEIARDSWTEILTDRGDEFIPPLTAHLPIQAVGNPDFIHVDAALNVCRRRVLPGLSTKDRDAVLAAREIETFIVQFALENPPLVPEMRASHLSLEEGKYPLAHAQYFSDGLVYEFDYFCRSIGARQSILWIGVTVTNETPDAREAHVRAKVNFQKESDLFDYHYQPFYWDASKWLPCDSVELREDAIYRDTALIGKVEAGDWKLEWEAKKEFGKKALRGRPHHVAPCMRLESVQDVIHFSAQIQEGEQKSFWIALLTDWEGATEEDRQHLMKAKPREDRATTLSDFQSRFTKDHTHLEFPAERWSEIFTALQLSTLQLCVQFPGEKSLMPTQGGSSERHYVWVWEAMYMLMPMLRLGQFGVVRQSLDFIFSLQDSGNPPEGDLTTTAGAVGTTGPKWLNTTGSALALAADYYLYSQDERFLDAYLPKMLKAMGWIVGELRATRKLNPDGSRPLYYGLMPFGCATDGDIGLIVTITDSFTFFGLEKAVLLLERKQHPRAEEFRKELEAYRSDLTLAIEGMTRPDGYIERKILTGQEKKIQPGFERICGAMILAYTGPLDVRSERFQRYEEYVEKNLMDGFFVGKMDREIVYIGTGELPWHHAWLRRGEWKKAFAANRVNLRYGMTQDVHQVQERFAKSNPTFVPWQPNGSGNGRVLEMMLNSLYFEHDGMVTLLGGVPWLWLLENGTTAIRNLHTIHGRVSLTAKMTDPKHCRLTLQASAAGVMPPLARLPEHFLVGESNLQKQDGLFRIPESEREIQFLLSEKSDS